MLLPLHLSGGRCQGPPAPRGRAGADPKLLSFGSATATKAASELASKQKMPLARCQ